MFNSYFLGAGDGESMMLVFLENSSLSSTPTPPLTYNTVEPLVGIAAAFGSGATLCVHDVVF